MNTATRLYCSTLQALPKRDRLGGTAVCRKHHLRV